MASIKELERNLEALLELPMNEAGFKREGFVFRRLTPGGSETFHLSFIEHRQDFDVTADVAVRYDDVEDLIAASQEMSINDPAKMSFGAELGNLAAGRQQRWTVGKGEDIPGVVEGLLEAFRKVAEPFFLEVSDKRRALHRLERDDKAGWLLMPIHGQRAMLALAICGVLGDEEGLERVAEQKRTFLSSRNDPQLNKVMKFADYLRQKLHLN